MEHMYSPRQIAAGAGGVLREGLEDPRRELGGRVLDGRIDLAESHNDTADCSALHLAIN